MTADSSSHRIRLGISTCLLGRNVRYDAGHKLDRYLTGTLGQYVEWVPVCPEVECGLSIPRRAMHLAGSPDSPRLIVTAGGDDLTERMQNWIGPCLDRLSRERLCGYVLKSKSPSRGLYKVKIYDEHGMPSRFGQGLFAAALTRRFPLLPVEEEGRLHDPGLRENFLERVFVTDRWFTYVEHDGGVEGLIRFHARHRCLIMAHSPSHLEQLGAIAASNTGDPETRRERYARLLNEALTQQTTAHSNAEVLAHLVWHLRHVLIDDEKDEIEELIERYRRQTTPLIIPLALIQHHVRRHDVGFLREQWYLHPHPDELMLRNRA
jgi:uncharacterized protein YbbK (DUF523 family)/uncharacterized protein YbgA (DUF1722 family)